MKQEDLQQVVPGFDDPVLGAQAVFRRALQALSMPGRPVEMRAMATLPPQGHAAAAMLLLALLDSDCSLWLSPSLTGSDAQAWLRFHTGCRIVDDISQARFVWLAAGDTWPALRAMNPGTDEYPDQSATCVMEVEAAGCPVAQADIWQLQGPGVQGTLSLATAGLPLDFDAQWAANQSVFPRGVDVFLATATQVVGLPRSTQLKRLQGVEA